MVYEKIGALSYQQTMKILEQMNHEIIGFL